MIEEAKKWVQDLEEMLNSLANLYGKSVEELDVEFEDWYNNGGAQWDMPGTEPNAVEAFEREYRANRDDEEYKETDGDEPSVEVEVVDGINYRYYNYNNTAYGKEQIGELAGKIGCRKVRWIRGKNVFRGDLMDIEDFNAMVELYNAYKEA